MSAQSRDWPTSYREALLACESILSSHHPIVRKGTLAVESEWIVLAAHRSILKKTLSRSELALSLTLPIRPEVAQCILIWAGRRAQGVPLQYVVGSQYFFNHEYLVDPSVLIPRPETEILVSTLIEKEKDLIPPQGSAIGLEIGLGSGCISIELLSKFSELRMWATEVSPDAIAVAQKNALQILGQNQSHRLVPLGVSLEEDLWRGVQAQNGRSPFDFIVSNPPYLKKPKGKSAAESDEVEWEVFQHEPAIALFAPEQDVLYFYRAIAQGAARFLKPHGRVYVEIPHERAPEIVDLFEKADFGGVEVILDLTQRPRVLVVQKNFQEK